MNWINKTGLGILVGTLALAGCDDAKKNRTQLAKKWVAEDSSLDGEMLEYLTEKYLETSEGITIEPTLKNAVIETYKKGLQERKLESGNGHQLDKTITLGIMIKKAGEVSRGDESVSSLKEFALEYIEINKRHYDSDITKVLNGLEKVADENMDSAKDFIVVTGYILDKCKANNISIDDFLTLTNYVSELDKNDTKLAISDDSVYDFRVLMSFTQGAINQFGASMEDLLEIAAILDNNCLWFKDSAKEISAGIYYFAQLYKKSEMPKKRFMGTLDSIADKKCVNISLFVDEMREWVSAEKQEDIYLQPLKKTKIKKQQSRKPEPYIPITIDQYLDNKDSYISKKIIMTGVPVSHIDTGDFYFIKLEDDKRTANCIRIENSAEVFRQGLDYVDIDYLIKQNELAMTKQKIIIYGKVVRNEGRIFIDKIQIPGRQ